MVSFDPNRPDFAPYGFTCVRWNPTPMRRPDRHNEIELNYLQSGWLVYLLGGRKVRVEANHLSAFWAALPHQILEFGAETEYFVATIPLPWFLQCRLPDSLVQPLLQGHIVSDPTTDRAVLDAELFTRWEHDLRDPPGELKRAVLLEMEARLVRFALAVPSSRGTNDQTRKRPGLSDGGLNKVEQMACLIAQRYTERLTVDEIGRSVGLHPNYAMNLFQKTFGTTLIEYLTQHRLLHAQRLLATTDQKIVDVAFASGFCSISRFNDAFRRACGCPPRDYRRQHQLEG
jgi:AraC family transcriptional regulator, melibiose operon regulatory protein